MRKLLQYLQYLFLLGLSVFLMWYALRGIAFGEVLAQLGEVNYFWLAVILLLTVGAYVSRAHRWRMQLAPLGYHISLLDGTNALMIGYVANLVLPRMGEVVRCSVLKRTDNIPVTTSFGTVITERVIDLVMLLLVTGLALLIEFDRLSGFVWDYLTARFTSVTFTMQQVYVTAAIGIITVLAIVGLLWLFLHKLRQIAFFNRLEAFGRGLVAGVLSIRRLETKGSFLFHTVFIWFSYFLTTYIGLFTLPATANLGLDAGLAIMAIGGIGMAVPVQGGIGVFHLMVSSTLVLYGLSPESGMAYALLLHTSQTLLVVLMGGIGFLLTMVRPGGGAKAAALTQTETVNP